MYSFTLKRCPLEKERMAPLLESLSARCSIDRNGRTIVEFPSFLPGEMVTERIFLIKEYLRAVRANEDLLDFVIDAGDKSESVTWKRDLSIRPFGAFGTGIHETTEGCLGLIRESLSSRGNPGGMSMLDIGTGTGVLSIAAYKQGIRKITAVDVSTRAVISSFHNFYAHGMQDSVDLLLGSIDLANDLYDLITANIRTPVHEMIFKEIVEKTNDGGDMILSGIKEKEFSRVEALLDSNGCIERKRKVVKEGWVSCLLQKRHIPEGSGH